MSEWLALAVAAAKRGGEVLRRRYGDPGRIVMKPHEAGPVSEADLASEAAVLETLAPSGIPVQSEERAGAQTSGRRWVVDPLDGTVNFIRHLPWFGVGVALATDDAVALGVVYAPLTDELFTAERGRGAELNGTPIRVSVTPSLRESCLFAAFDRRMLADPVRIDRLARIAERGPEFRSPNAALVDLAYVAAGRADGFWEAGLSPWDMAAGSVIVEEAGGTTSDLDGAPVRLEGNGIVATNGRIHAALVAVMGDGRRKG